MQKKNYSSGDESSSEWKKSLKKEERKGLLKKALIWTGVAVACIAGLVLLVKMAGTSSAPSTAPVEVANFPGPRENDITLGNSKATVVITEYADFQCPACASYNPLVNKMLKDYDGKIKVVYRFFPLSIHKNAKISGQTAYAAFKMGKFGEMKDLLYENQPSWEGLNDPKQIFIAYAKDLVLDTGKFEALMNSDEAKKAVDSGEKEAVGLGLNSTPTFFLGNKQILPRDESQFKKLIDTELKNQKPLQ